VSAPLTYVSALALTLRELLDDSGWEEGEDLDLIEDGHGNVARFEELDDGHIRLTVEDGDDVSELLDHVPFHLEGPEDRSPSDGGLSARRRR